MKELLKEIGLAAVVVFGTALLGTVGRMVDTLWDEIDFVIRKIRYRKNS